MSLSKCVTLFLFLTLLLSTCRANNPDDGEATVENVPDSVHDTRPDPSDVPADEQLSAWKKAHEKIPPPIATDQLGRPYPSLTSSLTVGRNGPILLGDNNLIQVLQSIDRERIPERWAHAKGTGAHGYFEVTDATLVNRTKAVVFSTVGKRTPVFVRFSRVTGERGVADQAIEHRGFAIKFYTEQGNYDMACLNIPVFGIKDPILVGQLNHAARRNPKTGLLDSNMFWDFVTLHKPATHFVVQLLSDVGMVASYRNLNGFAVHAFKLVNFGGTPCFVKFQWVPGQGNKVFTLEQLLTSRGVDPDAFNQDLYDNIAQGNYPFWDLFVQILTVEQAQKYRFNVFDSTKVVLQEDFPLQRVGRLVLNRNPSNFFEEVEMAAFAPGNLIPGIEFSPDPLLHGRGFSYVDTQRYRLGANFMKLAINRPRLPARVNTYDRDGACFHDEPHDDYEGPNYFPNSVGGPVVDHSLGGESSFFLSGQVARYEDDDGTVNEDHEFFAQPRIFIQKLAPDALQRLVTITAFALSRITYEPAFNRALENFRRVDPRFADTVNATIQVFKSSPLNA